MAWIKANKKKVIVGAIVLVVIIFMSLFGGDEETTFDTVVAVKQDLKQEINATGRVEAILQSDLAFEKSGRVGDIYVAVGSEVTKGELLMSLSSAESSAELAQARASVESARATLQQYEASLLNQLAKLDELKVGTRAEEILIYESRVNSAESSLESARESMINVIKDGYTRVEDSIRNSADELFNSPRTINADLKFNTTNSSLESSINSSRVLLEGKLTSWRTDLDFINSAADLEPYISTAKTNLEITKSFLEDIASALNDAITGPTVTSTQIDTWRASISLARSSVNLGLTNFTAGKEKLNNAESALVVAQNELALKKAPSTPEQISAQEASIEQARANIISQKAQISLQEASVLGVEARFAKNNLRSPISGIVTKQDAKVGEIVTANQIVVSVISDGDFELEAYIVEADIVGLQVGDEAVLTLDAYGDDVVFEATVVEIDPAAEQIEGVANYRTTLELATNDDRIKAGMTADIDIVTDEREGAIAIPQRAVIFKDNNKIARLLIGGEVVEVDVETGIRGERGLIEIVSGIEEGDTVITGVNE